MYLREKESGGEMRKKILLGVLVAVLMAGLFAPEESAAQTAFYVEEMKDGRIYVFNDPKMYKLFQESGELEVRITRIGAGPNGETIYFDSENAIHLYNFKHNLPAEVIIKAEEKKPTMKVSWKDGKTTIETDNAALVISNRIQVRYTYEDPGSSLPPTQAGDSKGSFRIRRAKTKFEGWFYNKNLTYELQLNWPDTANPLEDAWLNVNVTKDKKFQIKSGQFKVPFGRQELTSSGSQEFVDRSIVSGEFAKGRDLGVQVHGTPFGGKLDWRVGVFNGNGRTKTSNDNADYQFDTRVTFAPWGDPKYSESDFESTDKPLAAFAVNYENNKSFDSVTLAEPERNVIGVDGVFKYRGLFAFVEYFDRTVENTLTGAETDSNGIHAQVGYFIVPKKFEAAFRYATWDPNSDLSSNDRSEYGVAFNYFYNKHNMKLQGDYRRLEDDASGSEVDEVRLQLQFIF